MKITKYIDTDNLFTGVTTAFEYFVSAMLLGWSMSFVVDQNMYNVHTYTYLDQFGSPYFWSTLFAFLGATILLGINKMCTKWRHYVGISMCIAGFLWGLISIGFILTYPPYSSEMVTYPLFSFFSYIVGFKVLDEAKSCRLAALEQSQGG